MEYEGQICRPPMERSSFMLPVAVGCSYNRCTFCTLFKHLRYRQLPIEQVEAELQRVHDAGGNPEVARRIQGVVAQSVTMDEKFETAIETALGSAMQNIITADEEDAKWLIGYLKRKNYGRATFLPLTAIRGGQSIARSVS